MSEKSRLHEGKAAQLQAAVWRAAVDTLPDGELAEVLTCTHAGIHRDGERCGCAFEMLLLMQPGQSFMPARFPRWALRDLTAHLVRRRLPAELGETVGDGVLTWDGHVRSDWGHGDPQPAAALFETPGIGWVFHNRPTRGLRKPLISGSLARTWSIRPRYVKFGWLVPIEVATLAHTVDPHSAVPTGDQKTVISAALANS